MAKLIVLGRLGGLNDYIAAERTNKHLAAKMKREDMETVMWAAKSSLRGWRPKTPVIMHYSWYERDRRRDMDNVSSYGRKIIQDALVKGGFLRNDGWAHIKGFTDEFYVDSKRPRIEVTFEEAIDDA